MGGFHAVAAVGAVPQVPEVEFPGESQVGLGPGGVGEGLRVMLTGVIEILENLGEYIPDGIWVDRPVSENILLTGRYVDFDSNSSGTILTPVVLFLHHHVELVDPVLPGSVF